MADKCMTLEQLRSKFPRLYFSKSFRHFLVDPVLGFDCLGADVILIKDSLIYRVSFFDKAGDYHWIYFIPNGCGYWLSWSEPWSYKNAR